MNKAIPRQKESMTKRAVKIVKQPMLGAMRRCLLNMRQAVHGSAEHTLTSQGCPRHKCQNDDPAELSVPSFRGR